MSEVDLMRQIQLKASELGHRLWRNNVAQAWAGQQIRVPRPQMVMMQPGDVLLRNARVIHAGLCDSSSDLIGIQSGTGRFIACEVKALKGRTTIGQESFIDMVNRLGGIGLVAKSIDDFNV